MREKSRTFPHSGTSSARRVQFVQAYSELSVLCHTFGVVPFLARRSLFILNSSESPTVVPRLALIHMCISQDCVTAWRSVSWLSVFIVIGTQSFLLLQQVCHKILTPTRTWFVWNVALTIPNTNSFTYCPPKVERSSSSVKMHWVISKFHSFPWRYPSWHTPLSGSRVDWWLSGLAQLLSWGFSSPSSWKFSLLSSGLDPQPVS